MEIFSLLHWNYLHFSALEKRGKLTAYIKFSNQLYFSLHEYYGELPNFLPSNAIATTPTLS